MCMNTERITRTLLIIIGTFAILASVACSAPMATVAPVRTAAPVSTSSDIDRSTFTERAQPVTVEALPQSYATAHVGTLGGGR